MNVLPFESPYDEHTAIIEQCISELVSKPNDDRFRFLEAIAFHADEAFREDLSPHRFIEHLRDAALRKRLLKHPATVPLLLYLLMALDRFNSVSGDVGPSSSERRKSYADAFFLTGKQGEKWPPTGEQALINFWFQQALDKALTDDSVGEEVNWKQWWERAKNSALRTTYKRHYKHDYDSDNDTHKGRMKGIRVSIEQAGGGGFLGPKK